MASTNNSNELVTTIDTFRNISDVGFYGAANFSDDQLVDYSAKFADFKTKSASVFYWAVGDLIVEAEKRGERVASQVVDSAGITRQEASNCAYVSRHIPHDERFPTEGKKMTWAHHRPTASLSKEQRHDVLVKARDLKLSVKEVEALVRAIKAIDADTGEPVGDETMDALSENSKRVTLVSLQEVLSFIANCDSGFLTEVESALKDRITVLSGGEIVIDTAALDRLT